MFHGSMVALITAMASNGKIDEDSIRRLVEFHIESGTNAIVAVGTTGESPTLTHAEAIKVIRSIVEQAKGRVPVIAGSGTNSTASSIELTKAAMQAGVDGCLIVTPYYNRPTQEGLYQHYKAISQQVPIPIILYNVPNRTGCDIQASTVKRLASISNIVAIKEATGDVARTQEILNLCDNDIDVYSGDDKSALALMEKGAKGVISVSANVAPKLMAMLCKHALNQQWDQAKAIDEKLQNLHEALGLEPNPIPVKWAAMQLGLCEQGIRLPLTPLSDEMKPRIKDAMKQAELI